MAFIIKTPTANESPDSSQIVGDVAVDSPSNTAHASTTAVANGDDIGVTQIKTCRWSGFQAPTGLIASITLKITHSTNGALAGATASNSFDLQYSLNGGGAWSSAVSRADFTTAQGPTVFSVALPASQDISQVQVRDQMTASAVTSGDSANSNSLISNIQLEIITQDPQVASMM